MYFDLGERECYIVNLIHSTDIYSSMKSSMERPIRYIIHEALILPLSSLSVAPSALHYVLCVLYTVLCTVRCTLIVSVHYITLPNIHE